MKVRNSFLIISLIFFLQFYFLNFFKVYASNQQTVQFTVNSGISAGGLDRKGRAFLKAEHTTGPDIITLDASQSDRTAVLQPGTLVFLRFPDGISGYSITPNKGVVEKVEGKTHLPGGDVALLKVVGKGTAVITVTANSYIPTLITNASRTYTNWSGYSRTSGGPYNNVSTTWIVPTALSCSLGDAYSSAWAGIDGDGNSYLIQAGTESDCISGNAFYQAWWEILPDYPTEQALSTTTYPVKAGDTMYVEIKKNTTNWTITLKNITRSWTFSTTQTFGGPQSTVEWILEAPTVNGSVATLTNYNSTSFFKNSRNNSNPQHSYSSDSIDMVQNTVTISSTSQPNTNTDGFSVAYGSTAPNPPTGYWTSAADSSQAVYNNTATKLSSGKILIAGGETATYTGAAKIYDTSTNSWSSAANLNAGRYNHTAHLVTVSGGSTRVIVIGGRAGSTTRDTAELYNPTNNTWTYTSTNMSTTRASHASVVLSDGKVLVTGGEAFTVAKPNADIYDPLNNSWSQVASMSAARYNHTAVLLNDGRVMVAGGGNGSSVLASTELYDPSTNTWSAGPSMNFARSEHRMVKLSDGRIMVTGGSNSSGPSYTAEIWDPNNPNTWSQVSLMHSRRYGHSMTLLSDGRVLVSGGYGGLLSQANQILNNTEVYDPSTDTWEDLLPMVSARMRFPAVLLDNGTVLVTNGYTGSPLFQTSRSEYYTIAP